MCVCGGVRSWGTGIEGTKLSLRTRPCMEETQERRACRIVRLLAARMVASFREQIPGRGSMWAKTKVGMEAVRL